MTENLGKLATVRNAQGDLIGVGRIISYCDAPTVTIQDREGGRIHWRADMVTVHDLDHEEVEILMGRKGTDNE